MFNWLNRKTARPSQIDDAVQRVLQETFLRSNDELLSQAAAEDIVLAFAAFMGKGVDYIPDERKLPYPKEVIRLAFLKHLSFCQERCRQEPNNSEWKKDLAWAENGPLYLSGFQAIDPDDEEVVRAANEWDRRFVLELSKLQSQAQKEEYIDRAIKSDEQIVGKWQPLFMKYFRRGMREDGITPIGEHAQRL